MEDWCTVFNMVFNSELHYVGLQENASSSPTFDFPVFPPPVYAPLNLKFCEFLSTIIIAISLSPHLAQMSSDNQKRKPTKVVSISGSSDKRVLSTV